MEEDQISVNESLSRLGEFFGADLETFRDRRVCVEAESMGIADSGEEKVEQDGLAREWIDETLADKPPVDPTEASRRNGSDAAWVYGLLSDLRFLFSPQLLKGRALYERTILLERLIYLWRVRILQRG